MQEGKPTLVKENIIRNAEQFNLYMIYVRYDRNQNPSINKKNPLLINQYLIIFF